MMSITEMEGALSVDAPAKINLTLRILRQRADGYHDLESVVAAVGLADTLVFREASELSMTAEGLDVPVGDDNLVLRAARVLQEACGVRAGAEVRLRKRIPLGRGLGGGSSDAAATLAALNRLWDCGLEASDLVRLGAEVGSDVPLFLGSPVCVMRGRGARLEPGAARPRWWVALAWPSYGLPTVDVYAAYDRLTKDDAPRPAATDILTHLAGSAREAAPFIVNDLEPAARAARHHDVNLGRVFQEAEAAAFGMTGSGSAYFALADSEGEAQAQVIAARTAGCEAVLTTMLAGPGCSRRRCHESDERDGQVVAPGG